MKKKKLFKINFFGFDCYAESEEDFWKTLVDEDYMKSKPWLIKAKPMKLEDLMCKNIDNSD